MATIERFEDMRAWREAYDLAFSIRQICGDGDLKRDDGLRDQMQRAAVSIMANMAEGFERASPGELGHFVSIAKGYSCEVRSHVYLAHRWTCC